MGYQGFFEILMITLISSKNLGGYKIMKHTVSYYSCIYKLSEQFSTLIANFHAMTERILHNIAIFMQ